MTPVVETVARPTGERFQLLHRLGRGSFCEVHAAFDLKLGRTVAIKSARDWSPLAMEALRAEYEIALAASHLHVVRVLDGIFGDAFGGIVMEIAEGGDLESLTAEFRNGGGWSDDRCRRRLLRTLWQLSAAVASLHQRGFLHRDLSPSNVMLRRDGDVALIDFGFSITATAARLELNELLGTPPYIAPELWFVGTPYSASTDCFSLGAVAFMAACEGVPNEAGPAGLDPREFDSAIPPSLGQVITNLVAQVPSRRPSALEFWNVLRQLLCDEASTGRRRSGLGGRRKNPEAAWGWRARLPSRHGDHLKVGVSGGFAQGAPLARTPHLRVCQPIVAGTLRLRARGCESRAQAGGAVTRKVTSARV